MSTRIVQNYENKPLHELALRFHSVQKIHQTLLVSRIRGQRTDRKWTDRRILRKEEEQWHY